MYNGYIVRLILGRCEMRTYSDLLVQFLNTIDEYNEETKSVLTKKFESMMATINPNFVSGLVKYYGDLSIEDLVIKTDDNSVLFKGFNKYPEKEEVLVRSVGDKVYEATYNIKASGAETGWFSASIKRYPVDYNNRDFVGLYYRGFYTNNPIHLNNIRVMEELKTATEQGIGAGYPVDLYKSHSWITVGKVNDQVVYGTVTDRIPNACVGFESSGDEISNKERKELLDMLYLGDVPQDNILSDCCNTQQMENN